MNELARVVALDDTGAWVDAERRSACGECSARAGCGTTLLAALSPSRRDYIHVEASGDLRSRLRIGDTVEIALPDELVTRASAILYALPLGLLLIGAIAGNSLAPGDAGTGAGAALGLGLGALLARVLAGTVGNRAAFRPQLVRRLASPLEPGTSGAIS